MQNNKINKENIIETSLTTRKLTINNKEELKSIILLKKFEDSIQVKNTEHICKDGSVFDYSSITDLSQMFRDYRNLKSIPLFDTSNVTNMQAMFHSCSNITSVPLFNTSNVTNMKAMFFGCSNLKYIPLLDTSNVIDTSLMFSYCFELQKIPIIDITNSLRKKTFSSMFHECTSLPYENRLRIFYKNDKIILKLLNENKISKEKIIELLEKYEVLNRIR
jgi:surface protein